MGKWRESAAFAICRSTGKKTPGLTVRRSQIPVQLRANKATFNSNIRKIKDIWCKIKELLCHDLWQCCLLHYTYTKHPLGPVPSGPSHCGCPLSVVFRTSPSHLHCIPTIPKLDADGVIANLLTDHLRRWRNLVTLTVQLRTGLGFSVKLHNDWFLGHFYRFNGGSEVEVEVALIWHKFILSLPNFTK